MKEKNEKVTTFDLGEELEKSKKYVAMYDKAFHFNQERFDAYAELMAFYQGNQHLLRNIKLKDHG